MAPTVFFDIETTDDPAMGAFVPSKPPAAGERAFPPPPFHKVEMVGVIVLDGDAWKLLDVIDCPTERETVDAFVGRVERAKPLLVGFNSRGFDLPVIQARSMRHGIAFPWSIDAAYRYSQKMHFDLLDVLTSYGAAMRSQLDHWGRLVGWPGKLDQSGKHVADLLAEGGRDHLRHYCAADVILTAAVYIRAKLMMGEWPVERARHLSESLVVLARRSMPALGPWLDRIDTSVWLPAEANEAAA